MNNLAHIRYHIPRVNSPWPVVSIGAGGIVKNAHLPAYKIAGIQVAAIFDPDTTKAADLAKTFQIPKVCYSMEELTAAFGIHCLYDVAVPGSVLPDILEQLPVGSFALLQKPMGENLQQAQAILDLCRRKKITAAVNFQLRYAPFIDMAKQLLRSGAVGTICNFEVYVNTYTPWELWPFLRKAARLELLYHSIHYLDLAKHLLGNPIGIFAHSTQHPSVPDLQAVRSDIILNYGSFKRAAIITNHMHHYGPDNQNAFIKIEGTKGAIKIAMGLLLNYPNGKADQFEYIASDNTTNNAWQQLPITGSWFPHAFIGSMHELIKAKLGETDRPDNSVEDCIDTMAWVEKAYSCGF